MRADHLQGDIAVVGMSAMFAGAPDVASYWQNIVDKVDAVREAPDDWAQPYFDPQAQGNDRIYTRKGGFLGDQAEFRPVDYGIMPNAVDGGEPDQYLALKLAAAALADAGCGDGGFDRERTGVILGRGTYVNRGYTNLMQHGLVVDQTIELLRGFCPDLSEATLESLRNDMKASLPPFATEMLPGLVPNVVTGRIANRLDLMGPNFIIDAACASSLIAVELGIRELLTGRCDMVLSGGVHASTPPQIYMIFCQLDALSRQNLRPFDAAASGTLLGEGAGILVLKRLLDAERDGDRIYAVIKATGTSSDGKALGLLAPRLEGEVLAMRRAYESRELDPTSVGLIEAHGTGIALGDQTEVQSLGQVFGAAREGVPTYALGSVKSMVGHCIPAAGAAGMIKTILALYHKVLPPTLCDEVNSSLGIERSPFYVNNEPRPWVHGSVTTPRRAAVNAFGFGGVNSHVVLEEYPEPSRETTHSLYRRWPKELFVLSAEDQDGLTVRVKRLIDLLRDRPDLPVAAVAAGLAQLPAGEHRLAVVAGDAEELSRKLASFQSKLEPGPVAKLQTRSGIYYARGGTSGRIAFLFPGEGAQYPNMLSDLCQHFPAARQWFDFLDATFAGERELRPSQLIFPPPTSLSKEEREALEARLFEMDYAAESVFISSMALHELLGGLGVRPEAMLGHSTGENTALIASGTLRFETRELLAEKMRELNRLYRCLDEGNRIPRGALLTVGACDPARLERELQKAGDELHLAMDNCPNQFVVFGTPGTVGEVARRLSADGAICSQLPFDRAYHTPLFRDVGASFREFYDSVPAGAGHTALYSGASAGPYPEDAEGVRALAAGQWSSCVRFREAVDRFYQEGFRIFVEVGPSGNLTSFVEDILRGRDHLAVSCDSRRRPGLSQLLNSLGRLYVRGVSLKLGDLYAQRTLEAPDMAAALCGDGQAKVVPRSKPSQPLVLSIPRIRLSEEKFASLRQESERPRQSQGGYSKVIPFPSAAEQGPRVREPAPHEHPAPPEPMPTPAPAHPPEAQDERLGILQSHFDLMRQFLGSQSRILQAMGDGSAPITKQARDSDSLGAWPLLGTLSQVGQSRLVSERTFDLDSDLFLRDHTLGGALSSYDPTLRALPVVPFTFSMEMVAEAAACLMDDDRYVVALRNLRGYRWLTLDDGKLRLRVEAERYSGDAHAGAETGVHVSIYQQDAGGPQSGVLVFEGEAEVGNNYPPAPAAADFSATDLKESGLADEALYSTGMFHGPSLQGVRHIRRWSPDRIEADLLVLPTEGFFEFTRSPRLQTDAGLLDAAGQLVGYWLSEQFGSDFNCFPFQVEAYRQYAYLLPPGSLVLCRGWIQFQGQTQIRARFELLDTEGRLIGALEGWQDRYFGIPPSFYETRLRPRTHFLSEEWLGAGAQVVCRRVKPFPEHFLDDGWAIWKRVLAHLVLNAEERREWYAMPGSADRRTEWLLGRIAAKDAIRQWVRIRTGVELAPGDVIVRTSERGKPYAHCPALPGQALPDLSITHSGGEAVAAVGEPGESVGVDLQRLDRVRSADLLEAAFDAGERALLTAVQGRRKDEGVIALWCAREAAAKASGLGLEGAPRAWRVVEFDASTGMVHIAHDATVFTVRIHWLDDEIFAVCRVSLASGSATSVDG